MRRYSLVATPPTTPSFTTAELLGIVRRFGRASLAELRAERRQTQFILRGLVRYLEGSRGPERQARWEGNLDRNREYLALIRWELRLRCYAERERRQWDQEVTT